MCTLRGPSHAVTLSSRDDTDDTQICVPLHDVEQGARAAYYIARLLEKVPLRP